MENPFLHKKFPDLQQSPEVKSAVRKKEAKGERIPNDPTKRIDAYLERIEGILTNPDEKKRERGVRLLKHMLHEEYVLKPDEVPESYFELQRRIAKERGHGDIEIEPSMRRDMGQMLAEDQRQSLDTWVNYLGSHTDAGYPPWFRYYAFRSMLKLSSYDKEKHEFRKRTPSTTAPYPDLNREALAYVCDALVKAQSKKKGESLADSEELHKLLQRSNFGELYAYALEKVTPASQEQKETIEGEWKIFPQGSDPTPLYTSLQGHGTGWCIAGESVASNYLQAGDHHIFYSKDAKSGYTVPRITIRMEGDQIAEVRGINVNQELEPKLVETAEKKFKDLPNAEAYKKKSSDMKRLTAIEGKSTKSQLLTPADLRFLYEFDAPIEGFGYDRDPRIDQIRDQRDKRADLRTIFNCTEEELQKKEHVMLKNIPKWKELPEESRFKKDFKFDYIWEQEYRKGRSMQDFAVQNKVEATPLARVFDISDVIRKKMKQDPKHPNYLTTAEVLQAIDEAGYRPATLEELVAYGRDSWKPNADPKTLTEEERVLQNAQAPYIYGLNSVFSDALGRRGVPYLSWNGAERKLNARDLEDVWRALNRFLVLRKVSS